MNREKFPDPERSCRGGAWGERDRCQLHGGQTIVDGRCPDSEEDPAPATAAAAAERRAS
jgi:hypothetical protein